MKALTILFCVLIIINHLEAQNTNADSLQNTVAQIRNSDITWDGNWIGYMPWSYNKASSTLLNSEQIQKAIPYLTEALLDSQRFVAAHVLLTRLNEKVMIVEDNCYNGVSMSLIESKNPPIKCLQILCKLWQDILQKHVYLLENSNCICQ
jgi:hypothetical protein